MRGLETILVSALLCSAADAFAPHAIKILPRCECRVASDVSGEMVPTLLSHASSNAPRRMLTICDILQGPRRSSACKQRVAAVLSSAYWRFPLSPHAGPPPRLATGSDKHGRSELRVRRIRIFDEGSLDDGGLVVLRCRDRMLGQVGGRHMKEEVLCWLRVRAVGPW